MNRSTPRHGITRRLFALWVFTLFLIMPLLACRSRGAQDAAAKTPRTGTGPFKFTNKLIGASSPYLLEHAHNPVNWYPWGPEALEKAKRENKPIFLSIGYSACHWCHVMAREDFENEEIASIMNAHFVCIKVDREQRPDIDAQYILAVQLMTGSGGWPLSVFLTPDRKPFYGGTYFPPAEFKSLLNKIVDVVAKQPDAVRAQAEKVFSAMSVPPQPPGSGSLPDDVLSQAVQGLQRRFDTAEGGFSQRPKFPEAPSLAFLLARYRKTGDKDALAMVTTTLDHMAAGGIYDQLGGGFHRYSTDATWRVPHFEKMLYDQAQLVLVYLEAYRITHKPRYKQVVEETLAFVNRELRDPAGGFTSTLDADSEGVEGKYYLWTQAEIKDALGDDAPLFDEMYGVTGTGDLDGKSVLHVASSLERTAQAHRLGISQLALRADTMRRTLLAVRNGRVRPATDDKVLASWNGLMIAAYARAYQVLGDERYRTIATEAARFLTRSMMPGERLCHSYRAGKAEVPGLLEDYAYTLYGLLALADATHEPVWAGAAQTLAAQMIAHFGDKQNGGFYTTSAASQGELLTRLKEGEDNAVPSANGIAAQALVRLAVSTGQPAWRQHAERTVHAFQPLEMRAPSAYPTLLTAYQDLGVGAPLAAPPPLVEMQAQLLPSRRNRDTLIKIHVQIQPGWHINAFRASASYLFPTVLKLMPETGVRLIRVLYPLGKKTQFTFSPDALSVYTDAVTLRAAVRFGRTHRSGSHSLRFKLSYQACNERACMAPASSETALTIIH